VSPASVGVTSPPPRRASAATKPDERITDLLTRWNRGEAEAGERAMSLLYDHLRGLAVRYLRRERSAHTLDAGALVHEAFLRLVAAEVPDWKDRGHFIGLFARVMRRVLVDYARERNAAKRDGRRERITLRGDVLAGSDRPSDLLALDEALDWLGTLDPQKAEVVELRFFAGLSIDETATALGLSPATVNRQWRGARAWLLHRLEPPPAPRRAGREA
jgi:RNA polymerase sigma factor (TIGR02999 family)